MYRNIYGEEIKPQFVDLDGNPIKRTPYSNPYNYDEYVVWKDKNFDKEKYSAVYSDRLWQWDYEKYQRYCQEVFKNRGQRFDEREPKEIEEFLSMYFNKEIKLMAVMKGCNVSSGFPYWVFLYENIEDYRSRMSNKTVESGCEIWKIIRR